MQAAEDFRQECNYLSQLLDSATQELFSQKTQFNGWTVEDIIGHLHIWNHAAGLTLASREKFQEFLGYILKNYGTGGTSLEAQQKWLKEFADGASGKYLYKMWRDHYSLLADKYAASDPEMRVAWAGPDMSTQSKMVARQMESWAHGQAIFDLLGKDRKDKDRIKNIAHLGVTTFSWTFRNRGQTPPTPKPFIELQAPSGAIWTWNEKQSDNFINGTATEFCQVVTQTRNIADTDIHAEGHVAQSWMEIAQCFAGPPIDPPAPGTRFKS